jgi:hypothetical protein
MYGIICKDNLPGHSLFANFRLALKNHYKQDFKEVNSINDLNDIKTLFIVDEHFGPHVDIWRNTSFIVQANTLGIKVIVFNFEKIFSSQFPWNAEHQRHVYLFNNLTQYISDINDLKMLNKKVINKQLLSINTDLNVQPVEKKNRILFIGQCNNYYPTRQNVLRKLVDKGLPLDIIITDRKYTYEQFLIKLNEYKYILNPLGTGTFLNLRFYEALKLGCIPIQQITPEMKQHYFELANSINFVTEDELNMDVIESFNYIPLNYYLEDYFNDYFNDTEK